MDHGWYTDDILVGGLEHEWIIFPFLLGILIPIDFHIFQGGWNHQPVEFHLY